MSLFKKACISVSVWSSVSARPKMSYYAGMP